MAGDDANLVRRTREVQRGTAGDDGEGEMSDLREALARAICASCDEIPDHSGDCQGNQYRWQDYLPCADAALAVFEAEKAK